MSALYHHIPNREGGKVRYVHPDGGLPSESLVTLMPFAQMHTFDKAKHGANPLIDIKYPTKQHFARDINQHNQAKS